MKTSVQSPTTRKEKKSSIILQIMLLFFLLISVITLNSVLNYVKTYRNTQQELTNQMERQLASAISLIFHEKNVQDIIARIIVEQKDTLLDFLDFEKYRPIQIMLQTVVANHGIDRIFFLDEYQELLLTNNQSFEQISSRTGYQQIAENANNETRLEYLPRPFLEGVLPYNAASPEVLCLITTIPLIHDLGDIYGYVVLLKAIEGNDHLGQRISAMAATSFVLYDKFQKPILSNQDVNHITYPDKESHLVTSNEVEFYSYSSNLEQVTGNQKAELVVLMKRQLLLDQQRNQLINSLAPFLAAIIISLILFVFIKKKVLNPIVKLTTALLAVSSEREKLSTRLTLPDAKNKQLNELDRMYIGFNGMMDQLQDSYEQLEIARHESEAANVAKSDFLANMSHEIRTPMNAVLGLTHLTLQTELSSKQKDYLQNITKSANALLGIINDILDFSKIEAGHLDIENVPFQLNDVLDNLANIATVSAEDKDIEVLFAISTDTPTWLQGDPLRLGQILINLTNNAIKFTKKGEVTVSSKLIHKDAQHVSLQFSIKDTGIGMTPKQQAKLFQAFTQVDTSTTRKYGGTGLGLSISKQLVELMGGEITVQSEAGRGSEFSFSLTLGWQASLEDPQPHDTELLKTLRVLVVDDNKSAGTIVQELLANMGANEITIAESGPQALSAVKKVHAMAEEPFDLILIDSTMPEPDGLETATQLKAMPRFTVPPIILMATAYGHVRLREQSEAAGLDGFLIKPITPRALVETVEQVFDIAVNGTKSLDNKGLQVSAGLRNKRILLVEDNHINQQIADEILQGAGMQVTIADNGALAVQYVEEAYEPFDAVLMDVMMPEMDGLEATHLIRTKIEKASLPIIAMTASVMQDDIDACIAAGMNDVIAKPVDVDHLFTTLQKWIPTTAVEPDSDEAPVLSEALQQGTLPNSLQGFDLQGAVQRAGGNKQIIYKLLVQFHETAQGMVKTIRAALDNNFFHDAQLTTHSMKGIAATLGISAVEEAAKELEFALKNNTDEPLEQLFNMLEQALEEALRSIAAIVPKQKQNAGSLATKPSAVECQSLTPDFIMITEMLQKNNMAATQAFEALMDQLLGIGVDAQLAEITENIAKLDFKGAGQNLQKLAQTLDIQMDEDT